MSELQKHQLATYLAERERRIDLSQFEIEHPAYDEHLRHRDGSSYTRAVNDIFDDDNHFNTD